MKQKYSMRLIISGTYSTGKTTTATALSIATGIPLINALSAREILTDINPGRRFQDMSSVELMALGLKRMEERIREETVLYQLDGSFISDGSILNEWIYGTVRMQVGLNPGAKRVQRMAKAVRGLTAKSSLKKYLEAYGQVANLHAQEWYTDVVHLPVEFEMDPDGHRPVTEKYRNLSDYEIQDAFKDIGFNVHVVSGPQIERLEKIIDLFGLPIVVPVEEAIDEGKEQISRLREAVARKIIENYKEPSLKEKISIITKY